MQSELSSYMYRTNYAEQWIQNPCSFQQKILQVFFFYNTPCWYCNHLPSYDGNIHNPALWIVIAHWDVCKIAQVYAEYDLIPFIHMTDEIINMQFHIQHVLELRPGIHYVGQDGV